MKPSIEVYSPGLLDYAKARAWQRDAAEQVRTGGREALALLQHPPIYTHGRRIRPEHLLVPEDVLRERGAGVIETDRGGDITFHGPGQLVGYPILDLRRRSLGPTDYVRMLETVLIATLAHFGIGSRRLHGRPGVWTDRGKIAAIGVRIERGISLHGFALNINVDLSWFDAIVPCGLQDAQVTSMAQILGHPQDIGVVTGVLLKEFDSAFGTASSVSKPRSGSFA